MSASSSIVPIEPSTETTTRIITSFTVNVSALNYLKVSQ